MAQRLTGMGFALVATPVMVLLYGPVNGVLGVIVLGLFASVAVLAVTARDVDWRRALILGGSGLAVSPLAAWLVALAPARLLLLFVGAAGVLSLLSSRLDGVARWLTGRHGPFVAGAVGGMLHTASGLSGPPLVAYAMGTRWAQRSFTASVQVVFIAYHVAALLWRGLPTLPIGDVGWLLVVTLVGVLGGALGFRFVSVRVARTGMLAMACLGTVAVLVRGLVALFG